MGQMFVGGKNIWLLYW